MTKPAVTFGDPEVLLIDYLKTAFEPFAENPTGISTSFPATTLTGTDTHIQVELEVGGVEDYPVAERAQVRVTCYAAPKGQRSALKRLTSMAQALIYVHPGDEAVAGCRIRIGRSDVTTDPDTKNLMCWFLAAPTLSPAALTAP